MRLFQIDAFADAAFQGNPAAVCFVDRDVDDSWMQHVGAEMNLAETAFLRRRPDGDWSLRWFTPVVEVKLCGHATLASAHALREEGLLASDGVARFHTLSGVLTTRQGPETTDMDFPAKPNETVAPPDGMLEALGASAVHVARNEYDYLVEVAREAELRALTPDYARLRRIPARGIIVTTRATTPGFDFVSRFFAPGSGVDEDPVTGSAHCALAPYWAPRLGKNAFVAYQASPRGGVLRVTLSGDRVGLAGRAVTVFRGDLAV